MSQWRTMVAATALLLPITGITAERLAIDPTHTYPNFTVSHLGFSMQHGRFNDTSGHVVFDREGGESEVVVTIQADSIDTGLEDRDEHLRSADFFHVAEHPELHYRSTSIEFHDDSNATVSGELTMLGETRPVSLEVDNINCDDNPMDGTYTCGFNATGTVKRSDFGMGYGVPAIGDDVHLRIQAEAIRE